MSWRKRTGNAGCVRGSGRPCCRGCIAVCDPARASAASRAEKAAGLGCERGKWRRDAIADSETAAALACLAQAHAEASRVQVCHILLSFLLNLTQNPPRRSRTLRRTMHSTIPPRHHPCTAITCLHTICRIHTRTRVRIASSKDQRIHHTIPSRATHNNRSSTCRISRRTGPWRGTAGGGAGDFQASSRRNRSARRLSTCMVVPSKQKSSGAGKSRRCPLRSHRAIAKMILRRSPLFFMPTRTRAYARTRAHT